MQQQQQWRCNRTVKYLAVAVVLAEVFDHGHRLVDVRRWQRGAKPPRPVVVLRVVLFVPARRGLGRVLISLKDEQQGLT